jgi:hypothetical protein
MLLLAPVVRVCVVFNPIWVGVRTCDLVDADEKVTVVASWQACYDDVLILWNDALMIDACLPSCTNCT